MNTNEWIGVEPFKLRKEKRGEKQENYAFDAETTKTNLLKFLRAY